MPGLVAASQEGRFTRVKHGSSTPVHAVAFCLETVRLTIEDIDHVVFYAKPLR
jgi:carbamoyltransferase